MPRWISTPGIEAKHFDTSLAQVVNPARNLSASITGLAASFFWLFSFCRWDTVSSRISAFSNLETFSPSVARAETIKSFNSSKHRLILARRFRSNIGFITLRYCKVREIGCWVCCCKGKLAYEAVIIDIVQIQLTKKAQTVKAQET